MITVVKAVVASAAALSVSLLAAPAPADAAARGGCTYPHVCLYQSSTLTNPTGRFKDVTAGWQWLTRSRGAHSFVNTRHDDVAYLRLSSGRTICVGPNMTGGLMPSGPGVTAIRISTKPTC